MKKYILLPFFALIVLFLQQSVAQDIPYYKFIRYSANVLHYDSASPSINRLLNSWERLQTTHQGNISIVHIGGSHVQAGSLTNAVRCNIMADNPDLVGPRGMIFPYSAAAKCNNPADYRVHCPQKMILTRNVYKDHTYPLGLCGIAVTASDTLTEIAIKLNEPRVDYATNRIILLGHSDQGVVPRLRIENREVYPSYIDNRTDRYLFNLGQTVDSFCIVLPCREGDMFSVTGILLDNRQAGFSYHSIGVNGASVPDYLRCRNFVRDLRLLHPDVVIFGIGINDASGTNFDTAAFRQNYLHLVDSVRAVNPDCAFIFVTNNDSFRKVKRRYNVNNNGALAREVFYRLAHDTDGAVWDQFEVMGGLKSMNTWYKNGLAQKDRVHFTSAGYQLVGDLFYQALNDALKKNRSK
jgi:lysophospholipase L1-like esterase